MASIEEEILHDLEENEREIAYVREQLSSELKEKFTDDDLLFIKDAIGVYFYTSGIFDTDDDEVEIDLEDISEFVCSEAEKEGEGPFEPEEVLFVVQADLDFQEQNT